MIDAGYDSMRDDSGTPLNGWVLGSCVAVWTAMMKAAPGLTHMGPDVLERLTGDFMAVTQYGDLTGAEAQTQLAADINALASAFYERADRSITNLVGEDLVRRVLQYAEMFKDYVDDYQVDQRPGSRTTHPRYPLDVSGCEKLSNDINTLMAALVFVNVKEADLTAEWHDIESIPTHGRRILLRDSSNIEHYAYANPEFYPEAQRRYTHWRHFSAPVTISPTPVAWRIDGSKALCGQLVITTDPVIRDEWRRDASVTVVPLYEEVK